MVEELKEKVASLVREWRDKSAYADKAYAEMESARRARQALGDWSFAPSRPEGQDHFYWATDETLRGQRRLWAAQKAMIQAACEGKFAASGDEWEEYLPLNLSDEDFVF